MLKKRINTCLYFLIVMAFIGFAFPYEGYAVPAAPIIHPLVQSDGTIIKARQWGDESCHGWETEDGYTIVFNKVLNSWTYAINNTDGELISSSKVVGKDDLPDECYPHMRRAGLALSKIIMHMTTKETSGKASRVEDHATRNKISQKAVSPSGTANIPVILVNFSDTTTTYRKEDFNTLLFGTGTYSMKNYYEAVSYGKFSVSAGTAGVVGWYTAAKKHDYYGENDEIDYDKWPGDLVYEAVKAADADVDFSDYDMDNDGYVDVVDIVHQGTGEEASSDETDIWSHRWALDSAEYYGYSHYGVYTTNDRNSKGEYVKIDDYVLEPEKLDNNTQETIGVFAHEYGHALGLPDLYDVDYSSQGIGDWSLMAGGTWNYVQEPGDRPALMDAWCKYFLDWVKPTQITETLTNEPITNASAAADVYQLRNGEPLSGEYFLVENRQKSGFDAGLPGAGLLIWHVDGDLIKKKKYSNTVNTKECYPSKKCSKKHYGVALMQADDDWELEKGTSYGDSGDPYPGSTSNTSFTSSSSPNSNLYNGKSSGVSVTNISVSGSTMTATLSAGSN
ncbi:MAG: M6 family metalloprotease domain-containing protein [Planctomycetota bacterium]